MTAATRRHLLAIHGLPCVVCWFAYGKRANADEAHHIEFVRGDHSDFATIPACKSCHDELHEKRRRPFYLAHKLTDVKLLAWTNELLWEHPQFAKKKLLLDTGKGCSVCGQIPVVNVSGAYWLCGACVEERLKSA